jgi:putative tryptophan/tyrosine transport system substrate-binding protein
VKRREFITALAGTAAWPFAARAQQQTTTAKVARIAYLGGLSPATLDPRQIEQFKAGLLENGLIEGQNITVDYLWGEGSIERIQQLAAELARRDLDVIVTAGPQPLRALLATGTKTPIVFAILNDPIADGFVQSLARPGGNVTGLSMVGSDIETKRVEVCTGGHETDAPPRPNHGCSSTRGREAVAESLGLQFIVSEADDPAKFAEIFADAKAQGVDGVTAMASPLLNFQRKHLIDLTAQHRLPSIWEASAYVRDGGLLSYGPSFPDMYRRSAGYVAKILKGQRPSDLPVEQPVKFELAVNLKTARTLGLAIPQALLLRADEVIE